MTLSFILGLAYRQAAKTCKQFNDLHEQHPHDVTIKDRLDYWENVLDELSAMINGQKELPK